MNRTKASASKGDQVSKQDLISMEEKRYPEYAKASLDTPFLHFILGGNIVIRFLYKIRSLLSAPFNLYLLPKCIPTVKLPLIKQLFYFTFGELILLGGLVTLGYFSYKTAFTEGEQVKISGELAEYGLLIIFLTASKSNSLFSFCLGIPFQRMIK